MTNPDNVGGLPELPVKFDELIREVADHANSDGDFVSQATQTAIDNLLAEIRTYGELCRAAPAGGEDLVRFATRMASLNLQEVGGDLDDRIRFEVATFLRSAPAGSGEVDIEEFREAVELLRITSLGGKRDCERHGTFPHDFDRSLAKADRLIALIDSRAALLRKLQQGADGEMAAIGKLIRTQDNRITESPIFAVEQRREYVTDADYNDSRTVWINDEGGKADAKEDADLEARYRRDYEEPRGWRRLAVFDVWEFVTACFTEQGCKDYIAANGHNLKETRIFAHGSYRNREWQAVRAHLIAASQGQEGGHARD